MVIGGTAASSTVCNKTPQIACQAFHAWLLLMLEQARPLPTQAAKENPVPAPCGLTLIGHEELEAVDASGSDGRHVSRHPVAPRRHRHVEAIVHDRRLRLALPLLPPRQQVVRHGQHKVDVHGGAARKRSGVAAAVLGGRRVGGGMWDGLEQAPRAGSLPACLHMQAPLTALPPSIPSCTART